MNDLTVLKKFAKRYAEAWCSQDPDKVAAFFVERAETIQIEGHAALLRHLGKDVQVLAEVTEIMHGVKRIP